MWVVDLVSIIVVVRNLRIVTPVVVPENVPETIPVTEYVVPEENVKCPRNE
jgi:hypothetical protein